MFRSGLNQIKIPAERFVHWMDLIRKTEDASLRYDYLEAFWESQILSKHAMVQEFKNTLDRVKVECSPDMLPKPILPDSIAYVFGGWHGLSSMFLLDNFPELGLIYSIDKEQKNVLMGQNLCNFDRKIVFQTYEMEKFSKRAYHPLKTALIVNTSLEHITQEQYNTWVSNIPKRTWVILQGNNYDSISDHIRTSSSLENFMEMNPLDVVWSSVEVDCVQFTRYMTIGFNLENYEGLSLQESAKLTHNIQQMISRTSYEL